MSVSFDWEVKDEPDASYRFDRGTPPPEWWRRWLGRAVLILILLALAGLLIRAWIAGRLKVADKVEAELRAVVELELRIIADGDKELFRSRQDPLDPTWQERQVARYISPNASQPRPAPDLLPADRAWEIEKVDISGAVQRVELVQWFRSPSHTADLPFRVNWFYRQDEDGTWYHVAPPAGYLGAIYLWRGIRLDVRASEAEVKSLDPTVRELASLTTQVCRWLACPQRAHYTLSLEDVAAPQIRGNRWALPAPYLTGVPDDEDAHAAWERALKLWVVTTLVEVQVGDKVLTQRVIYQQLLTRLQAELELAEPPSPDVTVLAQALRERAQHGVEELWEATYDGADPDETRLIEAETIALLQLIADQVGSQRIFELLPTLRFHYRPGDVALFTLFDLDREDFTASWSAYLSHLTGVDVVVPQPTIPAAHASDQPLRPPPAPPPPAVPPGDHIALVCDGRVWVGNADGSQVAPLTANGYRFTSLQWSPDGRWLLARWQHTFTERQDALYLLAADGSGGRLLTDERVAKIAPLGWNSDGRDAIYAILPDATESDIEIRAVDLDTGETRRLPGWPTWSPDGQHLSYVVSPITDSGSAWLAGGSWENARHVADRASPIWRANNWSPDSSRVALEQYDANTEMSVAVYDLEVDSLTTLVTAADLTAALLSFSGDLVIEDADLAFLKYGSLPQMWTFGWSADGADVLVWAHRIGPTATTAGRTDLSALVAVPLDGLAPRVLVYGEGNLSASAAWSPTDPDRLAFTWPPPESPDEAPGAILFDLDTGPVYTTTQVRSFAWAPDGAWLALSTQDQIVIVDHEGQERFSLQPEPSASCSTAAWNPAANLSGLSEKASNPPTE